jgi:hypothetical protein
MKDGGPSLLVLCPRRPPEGGPLRHATDTRGLVGRRHLPHSRAKIVPAGRWPCRGPCCHHRCVKAQERETLPALAGEVGLGSLLPARALCRHVRRALRLGLARGLDGTADRRDRAGLPPPRAATLREECPLGDSPSITGEKNGSALNVEITRKARGFAALKTETCEHMQAAYLHV